MNGLFSYINVLTIFASYLFFFFAYKFLSAYLSQKKLKALAVELGLSYTRKIDRTIVYKGEDIDINYHSHRPFASGFIYGNHNDIEVSITVSPYRRKSLICFAIHREYLSMDLMLTNLPLKESRLQRIGGDLVDLNHSIIANYIIAKGNDKDEVLKLLSDKQFESAILDLCKLDQSLMIDDKVIEIETKIVKHDGLSSIKHTLDMLTDLYKPIQGLKLNTLKS